jgi:hypothetical protein
MAANENVQPTSVAGVDMKLEVVVIPVSDAERAKAFYLSLGWRLDATPPVLFSSRHPAPVERICPTSTS